jgi:hypothetical protein
VASQHSGELTPRVTLTRQRLDLAASGDQIEALAARFAAEHVLHLPQFFGDDLLAQFDHRLPQAAFHTRIDNGLVIEETLDDGALIGLMTMAMNDPALFRLVDRLTGCGPIGNFTGRVQQRGASDGRSHYYPWHTDATEGRLVGITVNLGREPFEGGVLQMRQVGHEAIVAEANNHIRGDAFLFRISEDYEHHVMPVTGGGPRLVLAGWFRRAPRFWP